MSIHVADSELAKLIATLATLRGTSEEDAVRQAVQAELDRTVARHPLREQFAALRAAHPLPPPTGLAADKAFFDDLSGEP